VVCEVVPQLEENLQGHIDLECGELVEEQGFARRVVGLFAEGKNKYVGVQSDCLTADRAHERSAPEGRGVLAARHRTTDAASPHAPSGYGSPRRCVPIIPVPSYAPQALQQSRCVRGLRLAVVL